MRSYRQYCALARALDVVGDRWTLLIVRELGLRGASRYTDLQYGLPGIATNLLADRLREMEEADIVRRHVGPPPVAAALFELTERGEELAPVLMALGRWGTELMGQLDGLQMGADQLEIVFGERRQKSVRWTRSGGQGNLSVSATTVPVPWRL